MIVDDSYYTRCSTFLECEVHVIGEDLSRQSSNQVESIASPGFFGLIELRQLSNHRLDPPPDAHQSADGFFVARIGHVAPQWGLQIDGVIVALLVQVLADEALVSDHQAGDL